MIRILKAHVVSYLRNTLSTEEEILCPHHHKTADIVFRTLAQRVADNIPEITRREIQLRGAIPYTGYAMLILQTFSIIVVEQPLKPCEDIIISFSLLLKLSGIKTVTIVEDKQDIIFDDGIGLCVDLMISQFIPDMLHHGGQDILLFFCQEQRLITVVGKEMITCQSFLYLGTLNKGCVEKQYPTVILLLGAIICLTSYLTGGVS